MKSSNLDGPKILGPSPHAVGCCDRTGPFKMYKQMSKKIIRIIKLSHFEIETQCFFWPFSPRVWASVVHPFLYPGFFFTWVRLMMRYLLPSDGHEIIGKMMLWSIKFWGCCVWRGMTSQWICVFCHKCSCARRRCFHHVPRRSGGGPTKNEVFCTRFSNKPKH